MKTNIAYLVLIPLLVLNCFGSLPTAQAVNPPPDGGYPGGNTAEGQNALLNLSSGSYNTAVGFFSLTRDSIGGFNTAIGAGTLLANTASNSVRYEQVNAMLLNEFLKEHRMVEELKAAVAQQSKHIETLTAVLEKVSARLEVSQPAQRTVLNNH